MGYLYSQNVTRIDSILLAIRLGISTHSASQYLSRIHRMGFLKRRRNKRRCITRKGKLCYKGYRYDYSFSSQGEQYIKWMKEDRIVPPILHYTIVDEVADYLPEEVRNHITNSIIIRENMRYKGPNRSLQTAGILAETIPYLTKALVKAETEREKLLEQNSTLEKKYSDSIKKIKERDKEINELEIENQKNKENTYKLTGSYTQYILGRKKEKKVYEKIIKDLSLVLVLKKQEKAEKLVKHIINRYSKEISRSEEYFRNAEKEFSM